MSIGRRSILKQGAVLAAASVLNASAWPVYAASIAAPAALEGMDLFTVYRKMFSSTETASQCCWWYFGTGKADVPDIGMVPTSRE